MTPREKLTGREIQVATMVWQGLTNREIGNFMGTTEQVVKNHLRNTFDKLGVWSRLELAMYVAGHGGKAWAEDSVHSGTAQPDVSWR
jgi:DNA-binding NarL/FixJ family response regulator